MKIPVIIEKDDYGYYVFCPQLKGCHTQGDSIEEVMYNIKSGFEMIRSKGGHRIYYNRKDRFILPFHKGKNLHPKIVKDLLELLEKN